MSRDLASLDRRALLPYVFVLGVILTATGTAGLIPPSPATFAPFLVAVGAATAREGWKIGLVTTAASVGSLLLFVGGAPSSLTIAFSVAAIALTALVETSRATAPRLAVEPESRERTAAIAQLSLRALQFGALPLLVLVVFLNLSALFVAKLSLPSILQPLIVLLAGAVTMHARVLRPGDVVARPAVLALAGYGLIVFAGSVWARDASATDHEVLELLKNFLLMVVAGSLAASWRVLRVAFTVLVCGAVLLSVLTLVQVAAGDPDLQFGGLAGVEEGHIYGDVSEIRPAGPFGDPNYFARILLLAFPLAAFLGSGHHRLREQLSSAAAAVLIGLAVLFTYSRGGMLTLAFVIALLVVAGRVRLGPRTFAAAAIAMVLLLPTDIGRRLLTIQSAFGANGNTAVADSSVEKRQHLHGVGWQIFEDHPLAGVGGGNFGSHYPSYAREVGLTGLDYTAPGVRQYAHNLYLELAAETGLAGLTAFVAAMTLTITALLRARRILLARGDTAHAALVMAIVLSVAGYLVASFFLHSGQQRYLWMMLGFAMSACRLTDGPRDREEPAASHA